jgi:protein-disulfide isomerase
MDNNLTPKEQYELKKQARQGAKIQQTPRPKKSGGLIWLLIGVAIVIFAIVGFSRSGDQDSNNSDQPKIITTAITTADWVKGNPDAKVTLIEYSDFQCPACLSYVPIIKELVSEFGNDIQFVYRHFPLKGTHPNAAPAARAAEAAGQQGKFWEMHDQLFNNQTSWAGLFSAKKSFITYAEKIGLDINQFETDYDSKEIIKKVDDQYESALAIGLNSTPSFLINGKRINNPRTLEDFRALIQAALVDNE